MRITEKRLRQIIRSALKEEATEEDVYGNYLFGDERGLPETDNEAELNLSDRFHSAFDGFMKDVTPSDVANLLKLRDEGKYADVLEVPAYAKRAWRVIEVDLKKLPDFLLPNVPQDTSVRTQMFSGAKLFRGKVTLPLHNYSINSWTITSQAMSQIALEDTDMGECLVILSCDLSFQKNKFILNPGNLQQLNPNYFWQAEIWQVAPVVCDRWAVVRKDAGPEEINKAVEMVK